MADMKNRFESVAVLGPEVIEQITKVSTVVTQQENLSAVLASRTSKGRSLDNIVLATEGTMKVSK